MGIEKCSNWLCPHAAECECDNCGNAFCGDHGTPGGDVQVQDVGAVARPSRCWECGGFDVDDETDEETEGRYAAGDAAFTMAFEEGE